MHTHIWEQGKPLLLMLDPFPHVWMWARPLFGTCTVSMHTAYTLALSSSRGQG